ncbi:MAG: hypothetical protein JO232_11690 [Verrucomicrobia bacterium]|nr:hypothetical protein [Verrucomicrobiota bacterium]
MSDATFQKYYPNYYKQITLWVRSLTVSEPFPLKKFEPFHRSCLEQQRVS